MKVLLLGGTGVFGKNAANFLARERRITEIALASRRLAAAQRAAEEIGNKARPVCVDILDTDRLSSIAADYDIVVNAAGPTTQVQVPALRAAIAAGVHYCDIGTVGRSAEKALQLDAQARANGVTAIIGIGFCAITSLMAVRAARQMDTMNNLTVGLLFDYSLGDSFFSLDRALARSRAAGRVETSLDDILEIGAGPVTTYCAGQWVRVEPGENPVEVLHPSGYLITAYPVDSVEPLTLPPYLPGVNNISTVFSLIPPPLNQLYLQQGQRIAAGETDPAGAGMAFLETALSDKKRWFSTPQSYPSGWWMWDIATGFKDGRPARTICWPSFILDWLTVPLGIMTLRILSGEIPLRGVLPTHACIAPDSFFEEAARYVSEEKRGQPLLNERFEWMG